MKRSLGLLLAAALLAGLLTACSKEEKAVSYTHLTLPTILRV